MDASLANTGTVRVELAGGVSQTLSLAGGGSVAGSIQLQAETAIEFGNGTTLQAGVTITGAGTAFVAGNVLVSGSIGAQNLTVANGQMDVGAETVSIVGNASQTGGTVRLSVGTMRVKLGSGTYLLDDGVFTGSGIINGGLDAFGEVSPGIALGTLGITGNGTLESSAQLTIQLGGATPGTFDLLAVGGNAIVGGQLRLSLVNGFLPTSGSTFTILTAGSVAGFFTNAIPAGPSNRGHLLFPGGEADVTYNSASVVLSNVVPEASLISSASIAFLMLGGFFRRRR
jgi:hypothetical protein